MTTLRSVCAALACAYLCLTPALHAADTTSPPPPSPHMPATALATFGAGCYWCVEAVFERLPGVLAVESGFMGGSIAHPSYEAVCTGSTGHAEVVQITYDPAVLSYARLLEVFWMAHDPTTLNRQGHDEGTQYRSAIFWHEDAQRLEAERSRAAAQERLADPIVTEITRASAFYAAKDSHQDFYRRNQSHPYCRAVIAPKLKKLAPELGAAPGAGPGVKTP